MIRLKVFISSVQKELQRERQAIGSLLATDPFLMESVVPRLFEDYPAPLHPNPRAYLQLLRQCHVYVLVIGQQYGRMLESGFSPTHEEYNEAQKCGLPTLVLVKGAASLDRDEEATAFFRTVRDDGHTYTRFTDIEDLQEKTRVRLVEHLQTTYDALPTSVQNTMGVEILHTASDFERQGVSVMRFSDLDRDLTVKLAALAENKPAGLMDEPAVTAALASRGYLWWDKPASCYRPTCAGTLLLAPKPAVAFPQARLQMDAFKGDKRDPNPYDSGFIDAPLPVALEQAVAFVSRNTPHPLVVEGLRRVDTSLYPEEALREAIVNALAHRDYANGAAKIVIELFRGRLVISSPGSPPGGQSIEVIADGNAPSRPRNPLLVQGLAWLNLMDERGSGIRRMIRAMREHELEPPEFGLEFDAVILTLKADPDRLREALDGKTGQATGQASPQVGERHISLDEKCLSQLFNLFKKAAGQVTGQVTGQVVVQVLTFCVEPRTSQEIQEHLELKHRETFVNNYLKPFLCSDWIEMTIPEKPRSSKQKYRLTEKGETVREELEGMLG